MKINITSVKFKSDSKLDSFIQEKVEKLLGIYENIVASEITLKLENNEKQENKVAEIKLLIRGNDLFAKKNSKTFEEAVDLSVEALRKQLTKHKEKIRH